MRSKDLQRNDWNPRYRSVQDILEILSTIILVVCWFLILALIWSEIAGAQTADPDLQPAHREDYREQIGWAPEVHDAARWWGISLSEASYRLEVEQTRYHYPLASVDRWYWDVMEAGWPDRSWPWVAYVMDGESDGNPYSTSRHRDIGLLQVNWKSWHGAGDRLGLPWETWVEVPEGLLIPLYVYSVQGREAWVADRSGFPDPQLSQSEATRLFLMALDRYRSNDVQEGTQDSR